MVNAYRTAPLVLSPAVDRASMSESTSNIVVRAGVPVPKERFASLASADVLRMRSRAAVNASTLASIQIIAGDATPVPPTSIVSTANARLIALAQARMFAPATVRTYTTTPIIAETATPSAQVAVPCWCLYALRGIATSVVGVLIRSAMVISGMVASLPNSAGSLPALKLRHMDRDGRMAPRITLCICLALTGGCKPTVIDASPSQDPTEGITRCDVPEDCHQEDSACAQRLCNPKTHLCDSMKFRNFGFQVFDQITEDNQSCPRVICDGNGHAVCDPSVKCIDDGFCGDYEWCDLCADCGSCSPTSEVTCPDGHCGAGESCKNCGEDCGPCCGNDQCEPPEDCVNCSYDCDCY